MRRAYVGTRLATGTKASQRSVRKMLPLRRRRLFETARLVLAILSSAVFGPFAGQSNAIGRSGSGESSRQDRGLRDSHRHSKSLPHGARRWRSNSCALGLAPTGQNGLMNLHRDALRAIAAREPLRAWGPGVEDLPWGDPEFSERMLREHLTQDHELASRRLVTIDRQVELLRGWIGLKAGQSLLDMTCGPGLVARAFARGGIAVTGVDIAPAAIRHAVEITAGLPCIFIEADAREVPLPVAEFDAALYLYGQPGVSKPEDQSEILTRIRRALRPGAPLVLEVRDATSVDRRPEMRWWTGSRGLFGRDVHLILTERIWDSDSRATVERDIVLDIETGVLNTFGVTERAYETDEIEALLADAGFPTVDFHRGWDGLDFENSKDWLVAIGR